MNYNVLIVDDEIMLAGMTAKYFNALEIKTLAVSTYDECLKALEEHTVELLLLDVNLKGGLDGFDLCKEIRQKYDTPIFFVSARDTSVDMMLALNIGGDDYITKPYDLNVLAAKIKARLKRNGDKDEITSTVITVDNIKIDYIKMKAYLSGKELDLRIKEFKLLAYLMTHPNQLITKEEIFYEIWGDTYISDNSLNVQISRLREKIEENPENPVYIKTVWGQGYMFEVVK